MRTVITEAYRQEQMALHATGQYGVTGEGYGPLISQLLISTQASSILDYGCGSRRSLLKTLVLPQDVVYEGYDPAVPDYADDPVPAELVTCIDVLEHIEPDLLTNVIEHLSELCDPYGFFTVHTGPARKILSDGRNAHLTQQPFAWWRQRFESYFHILSVHQVPSGFCLFVHAKSSQPPVKLQSILSPLGSLPALNQVTGAPISSIASASSAVTSGNQVEHSVGVVEHDGVRMKFQTPNKMTAWRVKSFYEKEPDTVRWLNSMPQGGVLLDVGANVGMYSVFAASVKQAKVYAFEPESQNYGLLNSNIALNELSGQVIAYPVALSDEAKLDKLYLSQFMAGGSCHSFGEQVGFDLKPRSSSFAQGCVSMTIDQLVQSGTMPVPDYIKLDVDGFEHKVLEGARQTLSNAKVLSVIAELNSHLPEHNSAIVMLEELGFTYDKQQALGAQRGEGAFQGVGEIIFTRGIRRAEKTIDFNRGYVLDLPRKSQGREVLNHVLKQLEAAHIEKAPFPYAVIDNIFPPDYYKEMLRQFPSRESLRPIDETGRVRPGLYQERLTVLFTEEEFARLNAEQLAFWSDLTEWMYTNEFLTAFIRKFSTDLEYRFDGILNKEKALKIRSDALIVNDQSRYAIGPHTDAPHRLITFLFYLPSDDSMRELGTSIYRPKDPSFTCWGGPHYPFDLFERVKTVEYLPNRLFVFPKTERTFHGVEEITRPDINRPLLINNVRLLNKTQY